PSLSISLSFLVTGLAHPAAADDESSDDQVVVEQQQDQQQQEGQDQNAQDHQQLQEPQKREDEEQPNVAQKAAPGGEKGDASPPADDSVAKQAERPEQPGAPAKAAAPPLGPPPNFPGRDLAPKVAELAAESDDHHPHAVHAHAPGELPRLTEDELARLTPDQRRVYEHRLQYMEEHRGHEQQHARMALVLMAALVGSQLLLLYWRRAHARSFQLASLLGLWVVPPAIGLSAGNYRYVVVWLLFSAVNAFVVRRALFEVPMQSSTPRLVYKWYSHVYNVSVAVGLLGYFTVAVTFFHIPYNLLGVSEATELSMFQ
ncbi:hypothetical protein HK405_002116, partial [Cladochytrium tenue]